MISKPLTQNKTVKEKSIGKRLNRPVTARYAPFDGNVRVPQFGWNSVHAMAGARLLEGGYAYFANSFRATEAPGWSIASATHGGRYVAAMERGNVVGCQFHPELSGAYGEALLARFLELA